MSFVRNNIGLLLAAAVLCLINVTIPDRLAIYDTHRVAQLLFVSGFLLICLVSARSSTALQAVYAPAMFIASGALLVLFVLSSYSALYPAIAFKEGVNTLLLLLLLLMAAMPFDSAKQENKPLVVLIGVGLLVYFFQMLVGFAAGVVSGTTIEREVIVHHISNIRFINHIQVLTLPLLLVFSLRSSSFLIRRLCTIVAILSVSVLLFLSARAALGSLFIASIALFALRPDTALIKKSVAILISGLAFYLVVFKFIPLMVFGAETADVRVNLNSSGRWDMWVESFWIIKDNWLLGVGAMHYGYWSQYGFGHPHNLALQVAIEYGVPFFVFVSIVLVRFTIRLFGFYRNGAMSDFELACFWAYFAIGGVSLFSGVWVAPLTQLMLVVIVAPLIGLVVRQGRTASESVEPTCLNGAVSKNEASAPVFQWLLRVIVIVCICALCVLVWNDIEDRLTGKRIDSSLVEKALYAPRFWQEDYWPKRE